MSKPPQKTSAKPTAPRKRSVAPRADDTPVVEWIAAGIGLALVLTTIGLIGSELFTAQHSPPDIAVHRLQVTPVSGGFLMTVRVENRGGSPAAGVLVEGETVSASGETETAEATFDFVPDHSSREGGLFFSDDPRQGKVTLRAKGYSDP